MKQLIIVTYIILNQILVGQDNKVCVYQLEKKLKCQENNKLIQDISLTEESENTFSVGTNQICKINRKEKKILCDILNHNEIQHDFDQSELSIMEQKKQDSISIGKDFICFSTGHSVDCIGPKQISKTIPFRINKQDESHEIEQLDANNQNACAIQSEKKYSVTDRKIIHTSELMCWGDPASSIVQVPDGIRKLNNIMENISFVSLGRNTACVFFNNNLKHLTQCWGTCPDSLCDIPEHVKDQVQEVSVGSNHACSINKKTLSCWGSNSSGQLSIPNDFKTGVFQVATGTGLTCALKLNEKIQCWGVKEEWFADLKNHMFTITTGGRHTCSARIGGSQDCWGNNEFGQLELSNQEYKDEHYIISAGWDFTCYQSYNLNLECIGFNLLNQIAIPAIVNQENNKINSIASGLSHSCAIYEDSVKKTYVACWGGWNEFGQLDSHLIQKNQSDITKVAVGHEFTCAVYHQDDDGVQESGVRILCFGNNVQGQSTNSETILRYVDFLVAGGDHACSIGESINCWGNDTQGQTTIPDRTLYQSRDINAGDTFTCAVRQDYTIQCWGMVLFDVQNQLGTPNKLNITANQETFCQIDIEHNGTCFGDNEWGQCEIPKITMMVLDSSYNSFSSQ